MYLSPVGYIPFCQDSLIYACWPDIAANRAPFTLNPVSIWMINYMVLIASGDEEVNRLNLLDTLTVNSYLCYSWSFRLFSRIFIWWNFILVRTETIHQCEQ